MSVSNQQQVAEETVVRLLRATRANDAETAPARHSRQTDQCPTIARFAAVFKCGSRWSVEENEHVLTCGFCLDVMKMFVTAAAGVAHEDTVSGLKSSEETTVALPARPGKPSKGTPPGNKPKPG